MASEELLASWNDTATRRAIVDFVEAVTDGPDVVPPEERVAVFDNDGTLWTEKPMPTQLHYIVEEVARAATADPSLAERQPYQARRERGPRLARRAIDKHYAGDDTDLRVIDRRDPRASPPDRTVDEYAAEVAEFYANEQHLTLQAALQRGGLPADGRAVAVPRGQRLHDATSSPAASATSCGR